MSAAREYLHWPLRRVVRAVAGYSDQKIHRSHNVWQLTLKCGHVVLRWRVKYGSAPKRTRCEPCGT